MANYISPFSKLFDFENICRGLYQKLANQETVCGALVDTGLSSSPQTTIECSGHLPIFVVMTLCANPCMADKTTVCCFVPSCVAQLFGCCQPLSCCNDRRRAQATGTSIGASSVVRDDAA